MFVSGNWKPDERYRIVVHAGAGRDRLGGVARRSQALRHALLGKSGSITAQLKALGGLPADERKAAGGRSTAPATRFPRRCRRAKALLDAAALDQRLAGEAPRRDPARARWRPRWRASGQPHLARITEIFGRLGTRWPTAPRSRTTGTTSRRSTSRHPSRASDARHLLHAGRRQRHRALLRGVQVRYVRNMRRRCGMIAAGKVYHSDSDQTPDVPHQVEGLLVDEHSNSPTSRARWPSSCVRSSSATSRCPPSSSRSPSHRRRSTSPGSRPTAASAGWKVLGCGMVHPNVLRNVGIDPERYTGFGVRPRRGALRDAALRRGRPARVLRQRCALPAPVRLRFRDEVSRPDSWLRQQYVKTPRRARPARRDADRDRPRGRGDDRARRCAGRRGRRAHRRMREASGSRQAAGLPGRCRHARDVADRLRRTERAPGLVAPLATIGTQVGELTIKAARLRASSPTACCARRRNSASTPMPPGFWNCLQMRRWARRSPITSACRTPASSSSSPRTARTASACAASPSTSPPRWAARSSRWTPRRSPLRARPRWRSHCRPGKAAPRFVGRVLEGVDATAATPAWMAERLSRSGVRPLSFLVDVTQYVMLELGQPMHAYDRDLLVGPIGVRPAREGEAWPCSTARRRRWIRSSSRSPMPTAWSAWPGSWAAPTPLVTDATRNVFLEAAHFAPAAIIGRSRKLGLHTDAGHRFERGVDPELPRIAVERATRLILEIAGGTSGPVIEAVLPQHLPQPQAINCAASGWRACWACRSRTPRSNASCAPAVLASKPRMAGVTAPTRRFDLAIEEDLIEKSRASTVTTRSRRRCPVARRAWSPPAKRGCRSTTCASNRGARLSRRSATPSWTQPGSTPGRCATWACRYQSAQRGTRRHAAGTAAGLVAALGRNAARQQPRARLFEIGRCSPAATTRRSRPWDRGRDLRRRHRRAVGRQRAHSTP